MTTRTLMGLASAIAGALAIAIAVNGWFNIEAAVIALSILGFCGVFAVGVYLIGAAVVLLSHETWISRAWERWTQ